MASMAAVVRRDIGEKTPRCLDCSKPEIFMDERCINCFAEHSRQVKACHRALRQVGYIDRS